MEKGTRSRPTQGGEAGDMTAGHLAVFVSLALLIYTYVGYPLILWIWGIRYPQRTGREVPDDWPRISIMLPAFNEESSIGATLESLLRLDYPANKRQIMVVSDGSTDRTNEIVAGFAELGVDFLPLPDRGGKTAAENAACRYLSGDIVVNTDASVRIDPAAIKKLVLEFRDPNVGVASGRDVSVARLGDSANVGESHYVGYDMWVRRLETKVSGIVGASGCLYAIRSHLHRYDLPGGLSRDFAAALVARERGFRSASVDDAICYVPRVASLNQEYRRKVRTITRGLRTLFYKRKLLNPFRYGAFAWVLFSHKLCRWLVPWGIALAAVAVAYFSASEVWARWIAAAGVAAIAMAVLAWVWPAEKSRMPKAVGLVGYVVAGNLAVLHAWLRASLGVQTAMWEPSRRGRVAEEDVLGSRQ